MPRLNDDERNQAIGMLNAGMSGTVLYRGTLVVLERLSSVYEDDSVSQETLPTVLEVLGHVWPLLPMIAMSSCSTYVTGVWLQQQPEDSMVFIHRLSEIGWHKTFNLSVRTDRTSVKFSPDIIERQGGIGAAVTSTSDVLIGIWFCFPMNFGLTLAMPRDAREFIAVGESVLPMRKWPCTAALQTEWANLPAPFIQRYDNSMRRRITACIAQNGGHMRYCHISLNL